MLLNHNPTIVASSVNFPLIAESCIICIYLFSLILGANCLLLLTVTAIYVHVIPSTNQFKENTIVPY